jgi:hypothetical protein
MSNKRRSKNQRDMRRIIQIKQEQKDGSLTWNALVLHAPSQHRCVARALTVDGTEPRSVDCESEADLWFLLPASWRLGMYFLVSTTSERKEARHPASQTSVVHSWNFRSCCLPNKASFRSVHWSPVNICVPGAVQTGQVESQAVCLSVCRLCYVAGYWGTTARSCDVDRKRNCCLLRRGLGTGFISSCESDDFMETMMMMMMMVVIILWVLAPCRLDGRRQRFGRTYGLHLYSRHHDEVLTSDHVSPVFCVRSKQRLAASNPAVCMDVIPLFTRVSNVSSYFLRSVCPQVTVPPISTKHDLRRPLHFVSVHREGHITSEPSEAIVYVSV